MRSMDVEMIFIFVLSLKLAPSMRAFSVAGMRSSNFATVLMANPEAIEIPDLMAKDIAWLLAFARISSMVE